MTTQIITCNTREEVKAVYDKYYNFDQCYNPWEVIAEQLPAIIEVKDSKERHNGKQTYKIGRLN